MKINSYRNAVNTDGGYTTVGNFLQCIKREKFKIKIDYLRKLKSKDDKRKFKSASLPCVTISALFGERKEHDILEYHYLMCLDFDEIADTKHARELLEGDPFTMAVSGSASGSGLFTIIRLEKKPLEGAEEIRRYHTEQFHNLQIYYKDKYDLVIDKSCKNVSRLRFVSSDPDIYINPQSKPFKALSEKLESHTSSMSALKKAEAWEDKDSISEGVESDVRGVVEEIRENGVIIGSDDYDDWLKLAFALSDSLGERGRSYFHEISRQSEKYDPDDCNRQYNIVLERPKRFDGITISTFFEYAKRSGIKNNGHISVVEGEVIPLYTHIPCTAEFPIDALPLIAQEYIGEVARTNQVDIALVANAYMATLSVALTGKAAVNTGTINEPLNLYICSILPSGERKSSTLKKIVEPIGIYEDCTDQQLLADDVTTESLGAVLKKNNERIGIISAEGGIFDTISGKKYSASGVANLDLWLKGYMGETSRTHRKTSEDILLTNPLITLYLSVQPRTIETISHNPDFHGRGFIARFLFSECQPKAGKRKRQDTPIEENLVRRYYAHILELLYTEYQMHTSYVPSPQGNTPQDMIKRYEQKTDIPILTLSQDSQEMWNELADTTEKKLSGGGELEELREWGQRVAGNTARIAGLLHMATMGIKEHIIKKDIMEQAIRVVNYYTQHSVSVLKEMMIVVTPEQKYAEIILKSWKKKGLKKGDIFTGRDILRAYSRKFGSMKNVHDGLNVLQEHGYISRKNKEFKIVSNQHIV